MWMDWGNGKGMTEKWLTTPSLLFHLKKPLSNNSKRTEQTLSWPARCWPGSQDWHVAPLSCVTLVQWKEKKRHKDFSNWNRKAGCFGTVLLHELNFCCIPLIPPKGEICILLPPPTEIRVRLRTVLEGAVILFEDGLARRLRKATPRWSRLNPLNSCWAKGSTDGLALNFNQEQNSKLKYEFSLHKPSDSFANFGKKTTTGSKTAPYWCITLIFSRALQASWDYNKLNSGVFQAALLSTSPCTSSSSTLNCLSSGLYRFAVCKQFGSLQSTASETPRVDAWCSLLRGVKMNYKERWGLCW